MCNLLYNQSLSLVGENLKYLFRFKSVSDVLHLFSLLNQELVNLINSHQVTVISGETGCGKTTQVTQFILDDYIERGKGSACRIVCTQPRRISAISVSQLSLTCENSFSPPEGILIEPNWFLRFAVILYYTQELSL